MPLEVSATREIVPVGAQVSVYYDPADPNHALLDRSAPGSDPLGGLITAASAVGLLVGLLALLHAIIFR